jgi:hypothetical protein
MRTARYAPVRLIMALYEIVLITALCPNKFDQLLGLCLVFNNWLISVTGLFYLPGLELVP